MQLSHLENKVRELSIRYEFRVYEWSHDLSVKTVCLCVLVSCLCTSLMLVVLQAYICHIRMCRDIFLAAAILPIICLCTLICNDRCPCIQTSAEYLYAVITCCLAPLRRACLNQCIAVPFPSSETERVNQLTHILLDVDNNYPGELLVEEDAKWNEAKLQIFHAQTFIASRLKYEMQIKAFLPLLFVHWPRDLINIMCSYLF